VWVNPEKHKVVGAVLTDFRKRAGLSQQELAARLGKPQSFVSAYEAGQRRVDVLELVRIAVGMDVASQEVFAEILNRQARS